MRSKAPLALMEQTVMILVFALAAALCLRVFVWSSQMSRHIEARDRAAVEAQCAAEIIKSEGSGGGSAADVLRAASGKVGGTYDGKTLRVNYDGEWEHTDGDVSFCLEASPADTDVDGLALVSVSVTDEDGNVLFEIDAAWQRTEAVDE